MRKLTQSVSRIIKFYLALVQTTGRIAVGYRSLREGLLIKRNVGRADLSSE
jgi:hypothetical protein